MPDKWAQYAVLPPGPAPAKSAAPADKWAQYATPSAQPAPATPIGGDLRPLTEREQMSTTFPVGETGESAFENVHNSLRNAFTGAYGVIAHPYDTAKGLVKSLIPGTDTPNPIQSTYQGLNTRPGETISTSVGQSAVLGPAAKVIPRIAVPALEMGGESLQRGGEGVINKNVLGVRKADIKRGANPGQGYFQSGFGPSSSMQSIAHKAAAAVDTTGEAIGTAIDNGTGSGVTVPGSAVNRAVQGPAQAAREIMNGPFGPGSDALDTRMAGFNGKIQPQMTPRQVFDLKRGVAKNVSWSDPTAIGTKQVGQQITGGLSGVLSDHVPELEPLNSQYQNVTSLENVASDRASTGQRSLTSMAGKAGLGAAGAALGYAHSPLAGAVAGIGSMALDSVPVKTSLASAMYYGGKGAVAVGNGIRGLYAPKPAAVPATFAFDPKPLQLPSSVPANAGFGAEPNAGGFPSRNPFTPPAPRSPLALPAATAPGETQPMIGVKAPAPYPGLYEDAARMRVQPNKFAGPPTNPFNLPKGYLMPPKTVVPKVRAASRVGR